MLSIASRDPPSPYHSHVHHMPIRQHNHSHSHSSDCHYNPLPSPASSTSSTGSSLLVSSMPPGEGGSTPPPRCCEAAGAPASTTTSQDAAVSQALEIARESPDGASDPTVSQILEQALASLWAKVQAQPESYVLTRDEFAVFNFFQHRFIGDKTAVSARKRYWDNAHA